MGDVNVIPLVDEGLGNSAYLVDLADGRALAVDASRDLRRLWAAAENRGLVLAYAADTHLHADFLTGAVALAAHDGATVLASAAGNREYPHAALADGDEVDLVVLMLRAWRLPATLRSTSPSFLEAHEHVGRCSRVARFWLGPRRAPTWWPRIRPSRWRGRSSGRCTGWRSCPTTTSGLPDSWGGVVLLGAARGRAARSRSASNAPRTRCFAPKARTCSSSSCSTRWAASRRTSCDCRRSTAAGPPSSKVTRCNHRLLLEWRARGRRAAVVDVPPIADFAAGHMAGSVSIELRPVFATWLGWLMPAHTSRWCSCATPTKIPPRSSGRPAKSATT